MKVILAVMSLLFVFLPLTHAQSADRPLFFIHKGDLYSYRVGDREPYRETYWGYNQTPRLSPDGTMLVYNSYPERLIELDAAGIFMINTDQMPPTNLWLMDIQTRQFTPIAQQPDPVGNGTNFVRRTPATWSPDSTKLAWLEWHFNDFDDGPEGGDPSENRGLFLVNYDLVSGTRSEGPYNLPGIVGDAGMLGVNNALQWGAQLTSVAFTYSPEIGDFTLSESAGPFIVLMLLADNQLNDVRVMEQLNQSEAYIRDLQWVKHQNQWYLALLFSEGWYLWDVAEDAYYRIDSPPALRAQSQQGLTLRPTEERFNWTLTGSSGAESSVRLNLNDFAISPDGETLLQVAYSQEGSYVIHFQEGEWKSYEPLAALKGINSLIWSPLIWQVDTGLEPSPAPAPLPTPTPNMG